MENYSQLRNNLLSAIATKQFKRARFEQIYDDVHKYSVYRRGGGG